MDVVSILPTFMTLPSVQSSGHQMVSLHKYNTWFSTLVCLQVTCLLWVHSTLLDCATGQGYVSTHTSHCPPPHPHTLHTTHTYTVVSQSGEARQWNSFQTSLDTGRHSILWSVWQWTSHLCPSGGQVSVETTPPPPSLTSPLDILSGTLWRHV